MALLSGPEVQLLRKELKSGSITGYWRVGSAVNRVLGGRAEYGEESLAGIAKQLRGLIGKEMLSQCRRLNALWPQADVKAAQRAGLSFRNAIALLALDGLAGRLPDQASALRKQRSTLVRRFARGEITSSNLRAAAARIKLRVLQNRPSPARLKSLSDGSRALRSLLSQAARRLEADGRLMPQEQRGDPQAGLTGREGRGGSGGAVWEGHWETQGVRILTRGDVQLK